MTRASQSGATNKGLALAAQLTGRLPRTTPLVGAMRRRLIGATCKSIVYVRSATDAPFHLHEDGGAQ